MSAAPIYAPVTLRDGSTVKALVEPGVEPPATRTALVALLSGAEAVLNGKAKPAYRDDVLARIRRALAAERGGRVVRSILLALATITASAACAHAQQVQRFDVASGPGTSCTPVTGTWSNLDAEGRLQVELKLRAEGHQPWPNVPTPPGRSAVYCLSQPMPAHARITGVRTFIATDRGHVAEMVLHVIIDGYQLVTRSEHKESDRGVYDAWKREPVQYVTGENAAQVPLVVVAEGWSTVAGATATMEFGVIVEMTWNPTPAEQAAHREAWARAERDGDGR